MLKIRNITSDRICRLNVRFQPPVNTTFTVLGVYLPCSDKGVECYREHIVELERLICEYQQCGPVVVAGDFNAHLGSLGGPRRSGCPDQPGIIVKDLIDRCSLHVMSLAARSSGPDYTFWSSTTNTTVDYIMGDMVASSALQCCYTHSQDSLNPAYLCHISFRPCI